jgi:ribonucleoside-diphosphate reductase alpha chain
MVLDGPTGPRSSTRTPTTRCASPTSSWRPSLDDADWNLTARTDGDVVIETVKARELMRQIAEAAWECADPGMQFDTTINEWHTARTPAASTRRTRAREYMHLDDSACNLASLNLMKFLARTASSTSRASSTPVDVVFTAQEILVGNSSTRRPRSSENARVPPARLGYANLGALLMARGLPYDSDDGRAYAARSPR